MRRCQVCHWYHVCPACGNSGKIQSTHTQTALRRHANQNVLNVLEERGVIEQHYNKDDVVIILREQVVHPDNWERLDLLVDQGMFALFDYMGIVRR